MAAQALLSTVDSIDCLELLQSMAPMSYDSSRLIDTACIGFAHVTHPNLASLRAVHEAAVQAQFQVGICTASFASCSSEGQHTGICQEDARLRLLHACSAYT